MDLRLERLTKRREADFLALMGRDEHGGQCWCSAWSVPTWDEYVADDIRGRGAGAVEGYPLHGTDHQAEEVWTGPESLYVAAGFGEHGRGPRRAVYRLELGP